MFSIDNLLRVNIKSLKPYSSARDEFKGGDGILLDANENSFGSPLNGSYNRYPDPLQAKLKRKLAEIKNVAASNIFIGNGSDEAIDVLFRAFCTPGVDNVIIPSPTYGMYEVLASINDIQVQRVALTDNFQLDPGRIKKAVDEKTKLIFLCSPNNPTGNSFRKKDMEELLKVFTGVVVIDEAYISFSGQSSFINELSGYPNLVVLQTLSKAWGLAALRIGMAFAEGDIISIMNKIKPPYNVSGASQQLALQALAHDSKVNKWVNQIVEEREQLERVLKELPVVQKVYPSDANFLLVKFAEAKRVYDYLIASGVVVRDRSGVLLCEGCLRITIGTPEENRILINAIKNFR